jgi:hypothetical protein
VLEGHAVGEPTLTAHGDDLLPSSLVTHGWRFGTASVTRGQIEFESLVIAVRAVGSAPDRRPSWRESWSSIRPGSRILRVHSDAALLEWALPVEAAQWAVNRLQTGEGSIDSP